MCWRWMILPSGKRAQRLQVARARRKVFAGFHVRRRVELPVASQVRSFRAEVGESPAAACPEARAGCRPSTAGRKAWARWGPRRSSWGNRWRRSRETIARGQHRRLAALRFVISLSRPFSTRS